MLQMTGPNDKLNSNFRLGHKDLQKAARAKTRSVKPMNKVSILVVDNVPSEF